MAEGVKVKITDRDVISALNTPGGAVFQWRDDRMHQIERRAIATSPVGNPLDEKRSGGVVGEYKASWRTSRVGSNQHRVRAVIFNEADHAGFVEYGRAPDRGGHKTSFTTAGLGGLWITTESAGYPGRHILQKATNQVMSGEAGPI